jgi:hypothetical protein
MGKARRPRSGGMGRGISTGGADAARRLFFPVGVRNRTCRSVLVVAGNPSGAPVSVLVGGPFALGAADCTGSGSSLGRCRTMPQSAG